MNYLVCCGSPIRNKERVVRPKDLRRQRLREEAENEPAVREALDLFEGRVVDVREAKPSREDS